jgi:hypothetical protein
VLERIREWWESKTLRERRLVALLGFAAGVTLLGWIGFQIYDGLGELEDQNEARQALLHSLSEHRDELIAQRGGGGSAVDHIGDQAEALPTYLESIETKVGDVKINNVTSEKENKKGKFLEKSVQVTLVNVTLDQVARFLERLESDSKIVVTQRLFLKRSSSDKEKLDRVEITVATYERLQKTGAGAKVAKEASADETEGGGDKAGAEDEVTQ